MDGTQDLWAPPVESGTGALTVDPFSLVGCNVGYQDVPWMLNQIGIRGISRPDRHLELFVMLLGPYLNSFSGVA